MRRDDRLLDLVRRLSDGRLHRAADLAAATGVTVRTVYRDLDVLVASGVPVAGTRGLGYTATAALTLPPLNLTLDELEALHLALARAGDDPDLAAPLASLSAKIEAALPEHRAVPSGGFGFATHAFARAATGVAHVETLRAAIRARQVVEADGRPLRPLRLDYWGRLWTLVAWDEAAGVFAHLRLDAIGALRALPRLFTDESGRTLADYEASRPDGT